MSGVLTAAKTPENPRNVQLATDTMRHRAKAAIEHVGAQRLRRMASDAKAPNLTAFLETLDPSDNAERAIGLDAFSRVLVALDIRSYGDPFGAYEASPVESLCREDTRDLLPEWLRIVWETGSSMGRRVVDSRQRAAAQYLSTDFAEGTVQRPYDDDRTLRDYPMEPAIPLTELVFRTRRNSGNTYRARYLTAPSASDIRLLRVVEASELPTAFITEGSALIRLFKFGRKLRASYEALRRLPMDDLATHVRYLALQTEVDRVAAVLDVMVNGDGNAGTAATVHTLTAMDSTTTANNLTLDAWLNFKLQFTNPFRPTHVFGRTAEMLKVLRLTTGNANTLVGSVELGNLRQELTPIDNRLSDGVRYGITTTETPAGRLVMVDGRMAVEHIIEEGSEISETDRWIGNQTEEMTFSVNEGFAVVARNTTRVLNLTA